MAIDCYEMELHWGHEGQVVSPEVYEYGDWVRRSDHIEEMEKLRGVLKDIVQRCEGGYLPGLDDEKVPELVGIIEVCYAALKEFKDE